MMESKELDKRIYTYALIKSLYDQGEDYVDCYWPFTIEVLPTDRKFSDLGLIQESVRNKFDVEIPLYTLKTIVNRAKEKNYVEQEGTQYRLTENGLEYLDRFETLDEVGRRINALLDDIKEFLDERSDTPTDVRQIHESLASLLYKNIEPLVEFFEPSCSIPTNRRVLHGVTTDFKKLLIEYIETAEGRKPEHYNTLKDMFLGSIISTILNSPRPSEITQIRTKSFKRCQIFLDTNFSFSVLGLHSPEFNEPAKELFGLLKEYQFELKVFSFTVDEITRVINGYPDEEYLYPTTLMVDTLYSSLKRRGWRKTDARQFIAGIENTLSKLEVQVEWAGEIDLNNFNPLNSELRNLISKDEYKPLQSLFYRNHDLAAMEKVKELRGHVVRNIEASKVLFLTSDRRLSRFNFVEMGQYVKLSWIAC